jgi:hypothetical protein
MYLKPEDYPVGSAGVSRQVPCGPSGSGGSDVAPHTRDAIGVRRTSRSRRDWGDPGAKKATLQMGLFMGALLVFAILMILWGVYILDPSQ